ncbi:MAG: hypothetical protein CM1200mP29_07600 [Verrucomicrobiota bacterium]|nr:MAG: hypothetical protein CM1200mP29_07600 [Verrucomicrobiota bacterium]
MAQRVANDKSVPAKRLAGDWQTVSKTSADVIGVRKAKRNLAAANELTTTELPSTVITPLAIARDTTPATLPHPSAGAAPGNASLLSRTTAAR